MFEWLRNFARRHKKKLIFTAVFGGGAYYAWRVLLPKLQELLIRRLLSDNDQLKGLLELAGSAGGGAPAAESEADREARLLQEKRARFEHKQQVSDSYTSKGLAVLQEQHEPCFTLEDHSARLREAGTKEAKLECFRALEVETLAFMFTAVYALHVALLLHRVQYNIIGREMDAGSAGSDAVVPAFLESTSYLAGGGGGLPRIAAAARESTRKCAEAAGLAPQTPVTEEALGKFLLDARQGVDSELLADSKGAAAFLPGSLDPAEGAPHGPAVKRLLDEARDYLESPQFCEAFRAATEDALRHVAGLLGDGAKDPADPAAAPLGGGRSCPLAKVFGKCIELGKSSLKDELGTDLVARFGAQPVVGQFCEALYFQSRDEA